jgi:hypothetical protein
MSRFYVRPELGRLQVMYCPIDDVLFLVYDFGDACILIGEDESGAESVCFLPGHLVMCEWVFLGYL